MQDISWSEIEADLLFKQILDRVLKKPLLKVTMWKLNNNFREVRCRKKFERIEPTYEVRVGDCLGKMVAQLFFQHGGRRLVKNLPGRNGRPIANHCLFGHDTPSFFEGE